MSTSGLMGITGGSDIPSWYVEYTQVQDTDDEGNLLWNDYPDNTDPTMVTVATGNATKSYTERDGFDLIWRQAELQQQMEEIEDAIRSIEADANLSDTEKMFALQMAANTWNAIATARTNILKCVSDVLKAIVRNIA